MPATRWSSDQRGIRLQMRMEPAAPVAGQEVRFIIDFSSDWECCAFGLSFGDGADMPSIGHPDCNVPSAGTGIVVAHTYAAAGSYRVYLIAAEVPCQLQVVDGLPVMPQIHGSDIFGCVGIGPGAAGLEGCSPVRAYGIDALS